ncbi:MAG: hypothetical protein J6V24_11130, partial [Clostridia bacterium]|nr:hypothetical protein [Clostridia bacterium]
MKDKKKFSVGKALLIAIPVILIGGAAAVIIPLHQNYQKNAYVPAPVEEAPEEFVNFEIPEYPELSFEAPENPVTEDPIILPDTGLGIPGTEIPEAGERDAETEAPAETKAETEAKPETEAETEAKQAAEEETEAKPEVTPPAAQQTDDPKAGTEQQAQQQQQQSWQPAAEQPQQTWQPQQPAQTWQPAEATPQTVNTPIQYDTKASFANSNAVSVYGYTPIYKVAQKDPDVENILVLGTDSRDVTMYRGNSDTMIV